MWTALATQFLAALVFVLASTPFLLAILRFRPIRSGFGTAFAVAFSAIATALFYVALTGPWLMYASYHGYAQHVYGVETPICDFLDPFASRFVAPTMAPAIGLVTNLTFNTDYDPSRTASMSNFDPSGWYTSEWMRYGMGLLTDDPPLLTISR